MIPASTQNLPEYEAPPVNEVACGVLFKPITGLLNAYLGLLWEKYRAQYPFCQEVPPLMPFIEAVDSEPPADLGAMMAEAAMLSRTWFVDTEGTGLIQVQKDRFLTNWRKLSAADAYPRYATLKTHYRENLTTFVQFINEHALGDFMPLQYELTYVNHIPQGEGWNQPEDIPNLFPDFNWRFTPRFLPEWDNITWSTSFPMPLKSGRLHIKVQSARMSKDGHKVIVLELTARGIGSTASEDGMFQWFDLAHEWIVRGFADFTSEDVQRTIWRRIR